MQRNIYVHIPFCDSKCKYCDFASFVCNDHVKQQYFKALLNEIENSKDKSVVIKNVFIGGGTPSSVDENFITDIISKIKHCFCVANDCEISIECNPCSASKQKLLVYKDCGINRISFGVQSLDDEVLQIFGRRHSRKVAINALSLAKECGFENISCDLMIGLAKQNKTVMQKTIEVLAKQNLTHISLYMLINESGTMLTKQIQNGQVQILSDDECVELYEFCVEELKKQGFERYEISNFAKNGYKCNHNIGYWNNSEFYGFGLAAHGSLNGVITMNTINMQKYLLQKDFQEIEKVDVLEKIEQIIMLGLRCFLGVDIALLNGLGYDILKIKQNQLNVLVDNGFIKIQNNKIIAEGKGYNVLNEIILKLIPSDMVDIKN